MTAPFAVLSRKALLFCLFICCCNNGLLAQPSAVDSLDRAVSIAKDDTNRVWLSLSDTYKPTDRQKRWTTLTRQPLIRLLLQRVYMDPSCHFPIQLLPPVQKGGFSPQSAAIFTHHDPFLGLTFARRFVTLLSPHFNFDNFRPASGPLRGRNSSQKSSVAVR